MGFDLKDIQNWIEDVTETIRGGKPGQVGNQNIQDAIINPGKILSEFSGITQGIKGVSPGSSNLDKGLALLTLVGFLGGQEAAMGLKGALSPKYAYGIHVSPVSGLKKIKPGSKVGVGNGGNFGDANDAMAYFFKTGNDKDLAEMQKAVNTYLRRLSGGTRGGATAYSVRTPLKHTKVDDVMGSFATQTPKNLKVLNSSTPNGLMDIIYDFTTGKEPHLPDNKNQLLKSLANLIKDNPKYSNLDTELITKPFEENLNKKLVQEISDYRKFKNKPKPKMVEARKPTNRKATP